MVPVPAGHRRGQSTNIAPAQLFQRPLGGGELLFPGGAFVGDHCAAYAHQGQGEFTQQIHGSHRPGGGQVKLFPQGNLLAGDFRPQMHSPGVEPQLPNDVFQKFHPFFQGINERDLNLRQQDGQGNARESRA